MEPDNPVTPTLSGDIIMSNVASFMSAPVTRERRIYSDTLAMMERVFFGVGIGPNRIDLIRSDSKANNRVLFHPTIDKKHIFDEPVTIEHVQSFIKGAEAMKHGVILKGSIEGLFAIPPNQLQYGQVDKFESSSSHDVEHVASGPMASAPVPAAEQMAAKAKTIKPPAKPSPPARVRRWAGNVTGSRATQASAKPTTVLKKHR